jgi:hypothetical protein
MFQEEQAVRALPSRIRVGKVRANVAQPGSAEQRVTESVRQNVAVGVSDRSFVKWEFHPANDQLPAFRETVQIVANAAAHAHAF